MTNEKAIKLIKAQHDLYDVVAGDWSFASMAIASLEKQIPKLVYYDEGDIDYKCPVCNEVVYEKDNYCSACGNAIKWPDDWGEDGRKGKENEDR